MRAKIEVAALRLYTTHRLYKAKDPVDLLATRRGILFHENERFYCVELQGHEGKTVL